MSDNNSQSNDHEQGSVVGGCMWCGHDDLWFDRSFSDWGDGDMMHYVCSGCGMPQLNPTELSYYKGRKTDNQTQSPYTVTLTFDMTDPDGRRHLRDALQGEDMRAVLWEVDQWLRNCVKYGVEQELVGASPEDVLENARFKLMHLCDEHGIRLDEE